MVHPLPRPGIADHAPIDRPSPEDTASATMSSARGGCTREGAALKRTGKRAEFRFYEELNDFLPEARRKRTIVYEFEGSPGIKDPIEALGIPHTEVELIVVNGESVGFEHRVAAGERFAVYPTFA